MRDGNGGDTTMGVPGGSAAVADLMPLLLILLTISTTTQPLELKKASQCFKSRGIPKVSFSCPADHMIKIHRAFHGIAVNDRSTIADLQKECAPSEGQLYSNCTQCSGDCIDDSMNLVYDWSTCMGNTSCIRTVMQSYMPACPGRDKFSDYLQVEYQCVPRASVINICKKLEVTLSEGYIMSPQYPYNYPTSQDCLCRIYTNWSSRITLSLYDLLLETKNGRCRADWLMLRQSEQKHRHCGAIMTGTKNITSDSNAIEIQFHSDQNDNRTQNFQYFTRSLKGFWLYFTAQPAADIKVECRPLTMQDQQVREIITDDEEFEEVVSTRHALTTATARTSDPDSEDVTATPDKTSMTGRSGAPGSGSQTNNGDKRMRPRVKGSDSNDFFREGEKGANYQGRNRGHVNTVHWLAVATATLLLTSGRLSSSSSHL